MRRKLTLSKETLRVLDDADLTQVVGGHHSRPHHDKKKKHNPGSRGSGVANGCATKSGASG
ncbi:MAG: class I lanthipeptide [Actinomycetota bacterium]|nr:class I lanthipeptide [Actinomycetota bacterium]